ncbi:metallophosphoesterase [Paenibacillus sp. GSMTC-2017]|uniref:metallophosphoesterase family protein n=1 Tax=Paenibacillus sp. GSMTC-2017 TaxID=2794350 RepID=UPI0018D7778D|nr:metallophosphoesterase [Paenibacillus sp. GSMTC-2017]MBH5317657.1 metallophosphoesterase [Paenibacillus sp. GSMTC-2017]
MKILVVSDEESTYIWDHFDAERFKDIKLIISCGDLKAEYLSFLVTMINVPLLYVHGNHDISYKSRPPEGCECIEDNVVTYNGIRIMGLGGSNRYSPGEFQYTEKQMRWRMAKLRLKQKLTKSVDILVTHAPAYKIGDGEDLCHKGFQCFISFMDQYNPRFLLHGHLNYGRNQRFHQYKNTKIINAFGYQIIEV